MRVLIVDDDRGVASILAQLVQSCGHEVIATISGGGLDAIRGYSRFKPELVFLDIMMPKFNGFTVCHELLSRDPLLKIVLMSGTVASDYPSVGSSGAVEFLQKPVNLATMREVLGRLAVPNAG